MNPSPHPPANNAPAPASIDDLDAAIRRYARQMNVASYRLLVLVREFDDRFGWAKWSCASCAEWLHWRIGIGLSAAREKVRVAHALRDLPGIAAAFEQGDLSYSKVRALTRAADASNERTLLDYALCATASQVEERCRQVRNVRPESAEEAFRMRRRDDGRFEFRRPDGRVIPACGYRAPRTQPVTTKFTIRPLT